MEAPITVRRVAAHRKLALWLGDLVETQDAPLLVLDERPVASQLACLAPKTQFALIFVDAADTITTLA